MSPSWPFSLDIDKYLRTKSNFSSTTDHEDNDHRISKTMTTCGKEREFKKKFGNQHFYVKYRITRYVHKFSEVAVKEQCNEASLVRTLDELNITY